MWQNILHSSGILLSYMYSTLVFILPGKCCHSVPFCCQMIVWNISVFFTPIQNKYVRKTSMIHEEYFVYPLVLYSRHFELQTVNNSWGSVVNVLICTRCHAFKFAIHGKWSTITAIISIFVLIKMMKIWVTFFFQFNTHIYHASAMRTIPYVLS